MGTSRSRAVIDALMAKLAEVREIEDVVPFTVKHDFGNLADAQHARPPRVVWLFQGGQALEIVPTTPAEGEPLPIGYRQSRYLARIWTPNEGVGLEGRGTGLERAEQLLDQLVIAGRLLPDSAQVSFAGQPYSVPTETDGKWLETGSVIDATVIIRTTVPSEPRDADASVTIADTDIRTGIENPIDEPESATAYEVNQWDGGTQTSES